MGVTTKKTALFNSLVVLSRDKRENWVPAFSPAAAVVFCFEGNDDQGRRPPRGRAAAKVVLERGAKYAAAQQQPAGGSRLRHPHLEAKVRVNYCSSHSVCRIEFRLAGSKEQYSSKRVQWVCFLVIYRRLSKKGVTSLGVSTSL